MTDSRPSIYGGRFVVTVLNEIDEDFFLSRASQRVAESANSGCKSGDSEMTERVPDTSRKRPPR